jgi:glycosyltransferase involved in cell wall biosynthesis
LNGWLVPASDVEGLARALHAVLEAPIERLRAMGDAGREAVLRMHDARREVDKLEKRIGEALAAQAQAAKRPLANSRV